MYEQAGDPERTMVLAVTRAYGYADDWKQRAEAAEQWQAEVPWAALRMVLDAAFQFAEGNAELWADCEQVEAWVEDHEIGDESCATIHPETWGTVIGDVLTEHAETWQRLADE